MNETVVAGETTFLEGLDPEFVANDLVNYDYVKAALEKYSEWKADPSVAGGADPYTREEIFKL
jgi:NitT/TauT family transport system substrate-binding protein